MEKLKHLEYLTISPEQITEQLNLTKTKTHRAIRKTLEEGRVKEKDLLSPFMQELVNLEREVGFVAAVKKLQHKLPKFIGFSIQQWYQIYQETKPSTKLHRKALEMMERLEFDAGNLEEMQILLDVAQPESQLAMIMQERINLYKIKHTNKI